MRKFLAIMFTVFFVPAAGAQTMYDLRTVFENTFYPLYLLNQRCVFLSQEEAAAFDTATTALTKMLDDFELLQASLETSEGLVRESEEVGREVSGHACDTAGRGLVEEGYVQIVEIATSVVPLYIDQQEAYLGDAFTGLAQGHALSLRCPGLDASAQGTLTARFADSRTGMIALVGENVYDQVIANATAAMSEENYGPCGENTTAFQQNVVDNTNYLLSRIDFLLNIRTP